MGCTVQPSRFLDAAILALFAMVVSAIFLYMFGELWNASQHPRLSAWKVGFILQRLFPFKRNFDFNLTHILLFTLAVLMLSLRPEANPPFEEIVRQSRSSRSTTGAKPSESETSSKVKSG